MTIGKGHAPCGKCHFHCTNIPIRLETKEPDDNGGYWYQVEPGRQCPICGEPMRWFHVPPSPISELLSLPVKETVPEYVHVPDSSEE